MRHRVVVMSSSMAEAVRGAGGWLFDLGMAGWEVLVLTPDHGDTRPLRILGAHAFDLDTAMTLPVRGPRPRALAVATDLYARDRRVRDGVNSVLGEGRMEVRLWGDTWPQELGSDVAPVAHRLSHAARAFKARALGAAACPVGTCDGPGLEATEVFRAGTSVRTLRNG
jgi:hypothetical protein